MKRICPDERLKEAPSLVTAVFCGANGRLVGVPKLHGAWSTLEDADAWISENFEVRYVVDYRKPHRMPLADFSFGGRAIVCVTGDFLYYEDNAYWSFVDLDQKQVVRVWALA